MRLQFWWIFTLPLLHAQPASYPSTQYAEVAGTRICYIDTGGAGVPVVFAHAATGSILVWEHQIPAFTAAGFRFIAWDRRGNGCTPASQEGTGADDLDALVDRLKIPRFHLVSTAGGGFVALDYALSFPKRLRSLTVANSVGGVQDPSFLELRRRINPPSFAAMPVEFRELGPSYRAADPEGMARWIDLVHRSQPATPTAGQPMRNRLTFSLVETIQTPALLLTGGADLYSPPAVMRMYAARIKGSKAVLIPESGHSSFWENPEVFNRTVLEFIKRH